MVQKIGSSKTVVDTNRYFSASELGHIFDSYSPSLRRYLVRRFGTSIEAEDIAQEAFLRLSRVKNAHEILKPESYLFRIAINIAGEHLIKLSSKAQMVALDSIKDTEVYDDGNLFQRNIEARSEVARVECIVATLPPLYKAVLLLKKRDGYSYEEIAEKLSISTHAVNRYLSGALQKCREGWER